MQTELDDSKGKREDAYSGLPCRQTNAAGVKRPQLTRPKLDVDDGGAGRACPQDAICATSPDPAPVRMACQQFLDELCVATMRCDPATTADQCDQQFASRIDCTTAIGVKLTARRHAWVRW